MLLTVGRSYVGNDVTQSTLLDRACACSYENLPKYRSYRVSNTAGVHCFLLFFSFFFCFHFFFIFFFFLCNMDQKASEIKIYYYYLY